MISVRVRWHIRYPGNWGLTAAALRLLFFMQNHQQTKIWINVRFGLLLLCAINAWCDALGVRFQFLGIRNPTRKLALSRTVPVEWVHVKRVVRNSTCAILFCVHHTHKNDIYMQWWRQTDIVSPGKNCLCVCILI